MARRRDSKVFQLYKHVLIISDDEAHAKIDHTNISAFAPKTITLASSSADALRQLAKKEIDLILCDAQLEDMTDIDFIQKIKNDTRLQKIPVVLITEVSSKEHVLDAIAVGCVGYIIRPYSEETFERYLLTSAEVDTYQEIETQQLAEADTLVSSGNYDKAIESFKTILSAQEEAQKYYDMGCDFLLQEKYGKAIRAFKKALRINEVYAEAYQGLAKAYMHKGDGSSYTRYMHKASEIYAQFDRLEETKATFVEGDGSSYTRYMHKASEIYAQFDRLEETKATFVEVLKYENDVPNPYNTLGVRLRRKGDYIGAIRAYERALELTPTDENIYYNLSKAHYFLDFGFAFNIRRSRAYRVGQNLY